MPEPTSTNNNITKEEVASGKGLSAIAYLGLLALIPYFSDKNNKFVRFHAVQGLNLFIIELIIGIGFSILSSVITTAICAADPFSCVYGGGFGVIGILGFVSWAIWIVFLILSVIGIAYATQGQVKELPVIGKFKIVKK